MNKKVVKKLIQAEILKYQALKELLPEKTRRLIEELENEAIDELKEMVLEIILDKEEDTEKTKKLKKIEII